MNKPQSAKVFHIRMPEISLKSSTVFLKWVNTHVNHGIPEDKTFFHSASFEQIFKKFKEKYDRMTNIELLNASLKVSGKPEIDQLGFIYWLENQSVEISVEEITPGRFNLKTLMVGPALAGQDGNVSVGYQDITRFQLAVYFKDDQYFLIYADSESGETAVVPNDGIPVRVFPVIDFNYELPRDEKKTPYDITTLRVGYMEMFNNFLVDYLPKLYKSPDAPVWFEANIIFKEVLRQQTDDACEIIGGNPNPAMFSIYTIEVPINGGYKFMTIASVSFGRRMTFMLPSLKVSQNAKGDIVITS